MADQLVKTDHPLTPKMERFVLEYVRDLHATNAALRAGYAPRSAVEQGCRLLTKPRVQEAIAVAQAKIAARLSLCAEEVIEGLRYEISLRGDPDEPNAARVKALELLGKHQGMFQEVKKHIHRHGGDARRPIQVEQTVKVQDLDLPLAVRVSIIEQLRLRRQLPSPEVINGKVHGQCDGNGETAPASLPGHDQPLPPGPTPEAQGTDHLEAQGQG